MNVLIFQDLFFYMEHIIFLGMIASRLFSLLQDYLVSMIHMHYQIGQMKQDI